MSTFMTYDHWVDTFKPELNPNNDWGGDYSAYETYGLDVEYVWSKPDNLVWTEVDGEEGVYLIAGKHYVNRIQYYVATVPWTDDMTEVPVQCYRRCDCTEEFEDGNPDCTECEYGDIDIEVDTVEDLQAIYGKDANIVG